MVFRKLLVGSVYFHYGKILGGTKINTPLVLCLRGLMFIIAGFDSCEKQHKLMWHNVVKTFKTFSAAV